jgi:hypothetical protein
MPTSSTVWSRIFSSLLLSESIKIRVCRTIILPVLSYGCGTWFLSLRKEHKLQIFEDGLPKKIFESTREETGENCMMKRLMICASCAKAVEKMKTNSLCSRTFVFENHVLYELMWKNVVQPGMQQVTVRFITEKMRFVCRITKARIQTHS